MSVTQTTGIASKILQSSLVSSPARRERTDGYGTAFTWKYVSFETFLNGEKVHEQAKIKGNFTRLGIPRG